MDHQLPPDVRAAWDRGEKVEAIRLLSRHTGLGLREAKEALESGSLSLQGMQPRSGAPRQLPASVTAALRAGNRIEAIKLLREATGVGLKEAVDLVASAEDATGDGASPGATGLAPGEMPRSRFNPAWLAVLVIAAAAVAWLLS